LTLLHNHTFWWGVLLAPIAWATVILVLAFISRQRKAVRKWYIGLPIIQWPAMLLVVIGCKVLQRKKYTEFMQYGGRFWLSPKVAGFKVESDDD
jgi:hypothetical protein